MCRDHYAVWSAVELVLNQRLVRRVCQACNGAGCADCLQTGYRGRVPAVEWLRVDDALRRKVREQGLDSVVPAQPLEFAARRVLQQGTTNQTEFDRIFNP
jgi:type II secretory ATPase GspE/PulE/Tfp pilus assembly ATPase PilB-like protein